MTYGDGVSDVDIKALIEFHQSSGRKATVTAIREAMAGQFFILEPSAIETIEDDLTIWERERSKA